MTPAKFWIEIFLPYLPWTSLGGRLVDTEDPQRFYDGTGNGFTRKQDLEIWKNKYIPAVTRKQAEEMLDRMFPRGTVPVSRTVDVNLLEFLSWGLLRFD